MIRSPDCEVSMFKKILVALDHSKADSFLLPHIKELARLTGAEILCCTSPRGGRRNGRKT